MKILFLDVDGVLNNRHTRGMFNVEKDACKLLQRILTATKAKIVLSSTWRYAMTVPEFNAFLTKHGVEPKVIDRTSLEEGEWVNHNVDRGTLIKMWLAEHPEIKDYAVVDDNSDAGVGIPPERFVQTLGLVGLVEEEADKLIWILGEATALTNASESSS